MPVEILTFDEIAQRLKITSAAARSLVKRHRLPTSRSAAGKTVITVDLSQIQHWRATDRLVLSSFRRTTRR